MSRIGPLNYKLLIIKALFLLTFIGPFLESTRNDRRALHFAISALFMGGFLFLSSLRFASIGLKLSGPSFFAGLNVFYIFGLLCHAILTNGVDRSNFSFILVAVGLYIGPNIMGISEVEVEADFINWFCNYLSCFLAVVTFSCLISNSYYVKVLTSAGLIAPQLSAALFLGIRRKNWILIVLSVLSFFAIGRIHYQTSYLIAPASVILVILGLRYRIYKKAIVILIATYAISVIFTNVLEYMLSVSGSEGYDNTIIRLAFAEYGINFVRSHILFGGALIYPVTIFIKNAGSYTTLPLHSDALTWLIGTGSIGWIIYVLTMIIFILKAWNFKSSYIQNSLAPVLICNFFMGVFNSQYSTYSYTFTCTYAVLLSLNPDSSRKFISFYKSSQH